MLLDSGASHNFLSVDLVHTLGLEPVSAESVVVRLADGSTLNTVGIVLLEVTLAVGLVVPVTFHVLDCNLGCILGLPFLG